MPDDNYIDIPVLGGAGGIQSINGDTTSAQVIAGGSGISVSTSAGTTTITNTGGGGGGTVTSVSLTAPSIFSVSGSPITGAGTLGLTLTTEAANSVFAGPTSGGAAAPTFRALVAADIPSSILPGAYIWQQTGGTGTPITQVDSTANVKFAQPIIDFNGFESIDSNGRVAVASDGATTVYNWSFADRVNLGPLATANATDDVVIGPGATSSSNGYAVIVGGGSTSAGVGDVVLGQGASTLSASGRSMAIGNGANTGDTHDLAIGYTATTSATAGGFNVAIGSGAGAAANANQAISIGTSANVYGLNDLAIGYNAQTGLGTSNNTIAIGPNASAAYPYGLALGSLAYSNANYASIIGMFNGGFNNSTANSMILGGYNGSIDQAWLTLTPNSAQFIFTINDASNQTSIDPNNRNLNDGATDTVMDWGYTYNSTLTQVGVAFPYGIKSWLAPYVTIDPNIMYLEAYSSATMAVETALDWSQVVPKFPDYNNVGTASEGMIGWDFTSHLPIFYNGSAWFDVPTTVSTPWQQTGGPGTAVTMVDSTAFIQLNTLSSAPAGADGIMYVDSSSGDIFAWSGSSSSYVDITPPPLASLWAGSSGSGHPTIVQNNPAVTFVGLGDPNGDGISALSVYMNGSAMPTFAQSWYGNLGNLQIGFPGSQPSFSSTSGPLLFGNLNLQFWPSGFGIVDNATGSLSIDANNRHLLATDGTTVNLSWDNTSGPVFNNGIYSQAAGATVLTTENAGGLAFPNGVESVSNNLICMITENGLGGVSFPTEIYSQNLSENIINTEDAQLVLGTTVKLDWSGTTISLPNSTVTTGSSVGTFTNAPASGNPTGYLSLTINGVVRKVPFW